MKLNIILENNWLEATWKENGMQVHCESFSGHKEHIALLRAKAKEFDTSLKEFEPLIKQCQDSFIYPTQEEFAQQAKEQAKQEALATIAQLEASQLRSIRELMIDPNNAFAKAKLSEIETKIQEERAKL